MEHEPSQSDARPGGEPERLKIDGEWEEAVGDALKKPRPPEGWPKKCDHARLSREVMFGQKTGDYVCRECGEALTPEEVAEIRARRG